LVTSPGKERTDDHRQPTQRHPGLCYLGGREESRQEESAVPGKGDHAGLNKTAIASIAAAIAAAVGGAVWFWRKKSDEAPAMKSDQAAVTSD
jgi:hypothetical protein